MSEETTATGLELLTINEAGVVPKERIRDSNRCRQLAQTLIDQDEERARADNRIKACVDGNPPYSATKLKKHAQSWRSNFNSMRARGMVDAAMVPYHDLLFGASYLANVRLNQPDVWLQNERTYRVSEAFDWLLEEEEEFYYNLMLAMQDRLRYGKGFLFWFDEYDFAPQWVNRFNVHVPSSTQACVEYLETLVIEEDIQTNKLWDYVRDSESATKRGWDPAEVKKAINRAESVSNKSTSSHPDIEQQKAADRDILDGLTTARVQVAHVFQQEFSGKISHYIVELNKTGEDSNTDDKPKDYLFRKVERYEEWCHCFWATFMDPGDGSWHNASGLGKQIIQHMEVLNRVDCAKVDLAFLRSAINLQATTEGSFNDSPIIQRGPINVLPPGTTPINVATFVGDLDGIIGLGNDIENTVGRNTGIYRQLPEKASGNPLTATGEMLRSQQATVLTNAAVTRFYRDLDVLYKELYRRAVADIPEKLLDDEVKEFRKKLTDQGLTLKELRDVEAVHAFRNIGNGSLIMRQQYLGELSALVPQLPPKGQQELLRDVIASRTDYDTADRYYPVQGMDVTHDHQMAVLENDVLSRGGQAEINPNENHVIHAQKHLQFAAGALGSVQNGADPAAVVASLDGVMPHAYIHIQFLANNPARKNEAKMLEQQWKQIAQANDKLVKQVQEIQKQQAEAAQAQQEAMAIQQGTDPKLQVEVMRTQADIALKQQRQNAMLQMRQQKVMHDMTLSDAQTAAGIRQSTASTVSAIQQQTAKTRADIENQRKKADEPTPSPKAKD